jgi:DNA modification methylase
LFYCEDARNIFLEKNSVDLFVTHPPYEGSSTVNLYGNADQQIHNDGKDSYLSNLMNIIRHMDYALKDNGRILLGVPARPIMYEIIAKIVQNFNFKFEAPLVWEFGNDPMYDGYVDTQVYFINIVKGNPYYSDKIDSLVIDIPWLHMLELDIYEGFTEDSVPLALCDIIIDAFTEKGDTVADLMAGTGSILLSAKNKGRNIIYNDVSEEQFNIAKQRLL